MKSHTENLMKKSSGRLAVRVVMLFINLGCH